MTVKELSGLDYLKLAFPHPDKASGDDAGRPPLTGYISKHAQKFDEEFDFHHQEWPVISEQEKRVQEIVSREGIDALAWYCPYSSFGKSWGIYFDVQAIDSYAKYLHRQFLDFYGFTHFGTTLRFLYDAITRHEVEHLNVELAAAMMIVDHQLPSDSYKIFRMNKAYKGLSECNATYMEFFDRPSEKRSNSVSQNAFYYILMNQPLPLPYSNWQDKDSGDASVTLELFFGTLGFLEALNRSRSLAGLKGKTKFIKVPHYYWYADPSDPGLEDSSCKVRLDCKSTISWVKKSEKLFPGQGITVEPGNDHDIKVKSKSQNIPVKLSCHDWNQIPPHVISQLAKVYEISKIQLMERIRKG
jgi:hypothetical protein